MNYTVEAEEVEGDILQVVVTAVEADPDSPPEWGPTVHQFPLSALPELVTALAEHIPFDIPEGDLRPPRLAPEPNPYAVEVAVAQAQVELLERWLDAERERVNQLLALTAGQ